MTGYVNIGKTDYPAKLVNGNCIVLYRGVWCSIHVVPEFKVGEFRKASWT